MSGGMHFESVDIRKMPLHYQEQVGTAILAQLAQTRPVAGKRNKPLKARVKRLCFPSLKAIDRYEVLKRAEKEGVIEELLAETYDGRVVAFRYRVIWRGEWIPTSVPVSTLCAWTGSYGDIVLEPVLWKRHEEYRIER